MTFAAFRDTLSDTAPPDGLSPPLRALWHGGRGDWDAAHEVAQGDDGPEACEVHAYLHRQEGDAGNAAYWYRRAGRPVATGPLDVEWQALVERMLSRNSP